MSTRVFSKDSGQKPGAEGVKVAVEIEDEERKWPLGLLVIGNEAMHAVVPPQEAPAPPPSGVTYQTVMAAMFEQAVASMRGG